MVLKPPPDEVDTAVDPVGPLTVTDALAGKYEPLTVIVLPGWYVDLSSEMCACGLHAYAIAAGMTNNATSIVAKVARRLDAAPVRPKSGKPLCS